MVLVSPLAVGAAAGLSDLVAWAAAWASAGAAISPWACAGSSSGDLRGTAAPGGAIGWISGGVSHPINAQPSTPAGMIRINFRAIPLRFDIMDIPLY